MINIAIFASGSGSNAENIIRYFEGNKDITVKLVVSNKPDALVHSRAKDLAVESVSFSPADFREGRKISDYLKEKKIDFVVLAGFLLKISEPILDAYSEKIINIHPALLPKYGGKGMYGDRVHQAVVEAGEEESGITIHYVNENYDEGDIIFQAAVEVSSTDTYEDVARKVHELEYEHFPIVIEQVIKRDLIS